MLNLLKLKYIILELKIFTDNFLLYIKFLYILKSNLYLKQNNFNNFNPNPLKLLKSQIKKYFLFFLFKFISLFLNIYDIL